MAQGNFWALACHLVTSRWSVVFASFLVMVGAGGVNLFGLYSGEIHKRLHYGQYRLNLLSSFKDAAVSLDVFSGLMAEITPTWFVILLGATTNLAGYLLIWMVLSEKIFRTRYWHMCALFFMAASSKVILKAACEKALKNNFPSKTRPSVILSGLPALGSTLLTQMFLAIFGHEMNRVPLLMSIIPSSLSLAFLFTLNAYKEDLKEEDGDTVLTQFTCMTTALASILFILTIIETFLDFPRQLFALTAMATSIVIAILCYVNIKNKFRGMPNKKGEFSPENRVTEPETAVKREKELSCDTQASLRRKVLSKTFFVVFFATSVGVGSTTAALDQVGQVSRSTSVDLVSVELLVQYIGVLNFFGRLTTKVVYDQLLKNNLGRALLGTLFGFLLTLTHISIAMPIFSGKSLFISYMFLSFSHGGQIQLASMTMHDFDKSRGLVLSQLTKLGIPLGSFLLKIFIISPVFESNAVADSETSEGPPICIGSHCFQGSFCAIAAVSVIVTYLWGILWFSEDTKTGRKK